MCECGLVVCGDVQRDGIGTVDNNLMVCVFKIGEAG